MYLWGYNAYLDSHRLTRKFKHTSYLGFRAVEEDVFEDQLRNCLPVPERFQLVNYIFFIDI